MDIRGPDFQALMSMGSGDASLREARGLIAKSLQEFEPDRSS